MQLEFKEINKKSLDYEKVKKLYYNAFPINERYPLFYLIWKSKSQNIKIYSIYDGDLWIGFIYIFFNKDLLFLQYIAIDINIRSKGYGGKVINKIKENYPKYRIV